MRSLHLLVPSVLLPGLVLLLGWRPPGSARGGDSPVGEAGIESLGWLAGSWSGVQGGVEMEELWLPPKGGLMLGLHRDHRPADGWVFFEYLRIVAGPEGIDYLASPRGRLPTAFRLVHQGERQVIFENPDHDYPQRVLYRLEETGELVARIEGESAGETRSTEWRWKKPAAPTER